MRARLQASYSRGGQRFAQVRLLVQGDEGGHGTPCLSQFIEMCSVLMNDSTELLLAFEPRASEVREGLLGELSERLGDVKAVPPATWADVISGCDHIELYRARKRRL